MPLCRLLMNSKAMPQIEIQGRIIGQDAQAERNFTALRIRYNAPENFRTNSSPLRCGLYE
ncbi:hypothetical protein AM571_PA00371 (plasmid) [Rhizobium etli 8C-3]|uniref:Uncharacterized protein n=1 Tax=Rhizobium etli 8C-3 TaxID=538025 RepID=A0A1L5PAZ0_RHIET|nr:hypothetical protein AM571_PA00371 [Rhizobium etli 8C-3]